MQTTRKQRNMVLDAPTDKYAEANILEDIIANRKRYELQINEADSTGRKYPITYKTININYVYKGDDEPNRSVSMSSLYRISPKLKRSKKVGAVEEGRRKNRFTKHKFNSENIKLELNDDEVDIPRREKYGIKDEIKYDLEEDEEDIPLINFQKFIKEENINCDNNSFHVENNEESIINLKTVKNSDKLGDISKDLEVIRNSLKDESSVVGDDDDDDGEKLEIILDSAKIKLEDEDSIEDVRNIAQEYNEGDLAYGKIGHHPYWPCLVVLDPDNKLYRKKLKKNWIYHVRFFGDKGRRSWIRQTLMLPLKSKHDLNNICNKLKQQRAAKPLIVAYKVAVKVAPAWEIGMNEALSLQAKSIAERYKFFAEVLVDEDKKKTTKTKPAQIKTEQAGEIKAPKKVKDKTPKETKTKKSYIEEDLELIRKADDEAGASKHTDSESDTESISEWTRCEPIVLVEEKQFALYKRNNLFKGVIKDKVCQECLREDGEILKCSGRCHGFYHRKCVASKDQLEHKTKTNVLLENMSLSEKIDYKLREIMKPLIEKPNYNYCNSDYSSSDDCENFIHVTGDANLNKKMIKKKLRSKFTCGYCSLNIEPVCLVCGENTSSKHSSLRQKCSYLTCGQFYHLECLKIWPQTQIIYSKIDADLDEFYCPRHVCHTCVSDDPRAAMSRISSNKVARCVKCPAAYHSSTFCIPAGTTVLSSTQIVCPRHLGFDERSNVKHTPINTTWCFICSDGGNLICCDTCPTSVHLECLKLELDENDTYMCEDCETGRLPLYDEIVWVKLGHYRWWPALILFPNDIPADIENMPHIKGEFVVRFCGTHDYYWVSRGRAFLFQEDDRMYETSKKNKGMELFKQAIEEAAAAHDFKKKLKKRVADNLNLDQNKPPSYVKIRYNKAVGNVRVFDGNTSNTTPCNCDPKTENPCGPDSDCLNRLLMTECDPEVCPAGTKCKNQSFEKREYPHLVPYKTKVRGWGLKTLEFIKKGAFVIEYVGEVIDDQEYQRRLVKMHEQKDDNFYFLKIDNERMIDAGPKGNVARFMNHCCQPNCETQKWTVRGDTRVGLFASQDISKDTEVTFNYNLESVGQDMKACCCGAETCSGFIGAKVKSVVEEKKKKIFKPRKNRSSTPSSIETVKGPCFICGKKDETFPCNNKMCNKYYHKKCINMDSAAAQLNCPWHNCNFCTKRTIRCCIKCLNSYCPSHSEGNIRHDRLLGFVCTDHDPSREINEVQIEEAEDASHNDVKSDVSSTTQDDSSDVSKIVKSLKRKQPPEKQYPKRLKKSRTK